MSGTIELLIRKLEQFGELSSKERQILENLPIEVRQVGADRDLGQDGQRSSHCLLLLDGMVCRYRTMQDGQRQIMSFHFPGDILDLSSLLLGRLDHGIGTLTPVEVAPVSHATLLGWIEQHPGLGRMLWQDTLLDAAVFREWVVNVGRRPALARTAHLLCEVVTRLQAAGAEDLAFSLPLTVVELADSTGLSVVHVNRVMQELRVKRLVEAREGMLAVLDWDGLKRAAGFDPDYLHQRAMPAAA